MGFAYQFGQCKDVQHSFWTPLLNKLFSYSLGNVTTVKSENTSEKKHIKLHLNHMLWLQNRIYTEKVRSNTQSSCVFFSSTTDASFSSYNHFLQHRKPGPLTPPFLKPDFGLTTPYVKFSIPQPYSTRGMVLQTTPSR